MGDYTNIINTAAEEAEIRGRAIGREEGRAEGLSEGRAEGLAQGLAQGLTEGREEGLAEGQKAGQKNKAIEIAFKLMGTGMSREEAAEFVGISESDLYD